MKRECYFCAFDFEDGTRLTPPEQSRAECFLKENVRLVHVQVLHPPAMLRLSEIRSVDGLRRRPNESCSDVILRAFCPTAELLSAKQQCHRG